MKMTQFLRLAVGLATALGGLHGKELIHKDVKPTNVLVNPDPTYGFQYRFAPSSRAPDARPNLLSSSLEHLLTWRSNRPGE